MMFRSLPHKHTLNYFFLKSFQNEINVSRIEIKEETTTASTTSTESTTTVDNRPVKEATLYNFVADQGKYLFFTYICKYTLKNNIVNPFTLGPGAIGVGLASLTYAAMASLPYWLPA